MAEITDWMSLGNPNPEWEGLIQSMGGQSFDIGMFPDVQSLRGFIIQSKKNMTASFPDIPGVKEQDHQIPTRDGSKITVRTYQPEGKTGGPLAVMFHGGGWCIGGLENEEMLCRQLCNKHGAVVVNVDYRLAPEHEFPAAVYDCHDATRWAAESASTLGADPSKGFLLQGTSAGGNIASVVSHLWRDEKASPPLTGCHLMIPAMCYHAVVPEKYKKDYGSWEQNKNAAILSRKACALFLDAYLPNEEDRGNELFSPLLWPTGHKGLPPTYFQICGSDPLRDEALIFERILREEEGIKTKVDVYPGLPHGFWSMMPQLRASHQFIADSEKGVQWLLEQK